MSKPRSKSQSISSTFSSSKYTWWSPQSPATVGSAPEIMVLRLSPGYSDRAYSKPQ